MARRQIGTGVRSPVPRKYQRRQGPPCGGMAPMSQHRPHHHRIRRIRTAPDGAAARGQGLVELALILPIFLALTMGLLEFALAFNATLGVNRASQDGAHVASVAGARRGADCMILAEIDATLITPADTDRIRRVEIQRTALAGNVVYARNTWVRGGRTTCTLIDGSTLDVPYTRTTEGYPESQRCTILAGCATLTPARSTVDNVGVLVEYRYDWVTPLGALLPMLGEDAVAGGASGRGWTFQKRSVFRMEPDL